MGRRADALKIAQQFVDLSSHSYVDSYLLAGIYAGLGDRDEAFRLLEKGYKEHSAQMPYLGIDVFWNGMRSDPRYADLLRRDELTGYEVAERFYEIGSPEGLAETREYLHARASRAA